MRPMASLIERYGDRILGVLSCYDRRDRARRHPEASTTRRRWSPYLRWRKIPLFDFPKFAKPYRDAIRDNAEQLARAERNRGASSPAITKVRKEDIVARILEKRGDGPGLVAILSALETCESYEARYDKEDGAHVAAARPGQVHALPIGFYFIDEHLGLCFMRVSTWCPFSNT